MSTYTTRSYDEKRVEDLEMKLRIYKVIHKESAQRNHGIEVPIGGKYEWIDYTPTRFIYSFFTFNTLYNIDWQSSLNKGAVYLFKRNEYDEDKQDAYLDFVFSDEDFVASFKKPFIDYLTRDVPSTVILEQLQGIELDKAFNGSIKDKGVITSFQDAMKSLLISKQFNIKTIKTILGFVYRIRCNIFHGVKSMEQMRMVSQKERIEIYTRIIIAVNQMCFSYIDYLIDNEHAKKQMNETFSKLKVLKQTDNEKQLHS